MGETGEVPAEGTDLRVYGIRGKGSRHTRQGCWAQLYAAAGEVTASWIPADHPLERNWVRLRGKVAANVRLPGVI